MSPPPANRINRTNPTANALKFSFNLADNAFGGQPVFAADAARLAYLTEGAAEVWNVSLEDGVPDVSAYP